MLVDFSQYPKDELLRMKVCCFGNEVYVQSKLTNEVLLRFGYESEREALTASVVILGELDTEAARAGS